MSTAHFVKHNEWNVLTFCVREATQVSKGVLHYLHVAKVILNLLFLITCSFKLHTRKLSHLDALLNTQTG